MSHVLDGCTYLEPLERAADLRYVHLRNYLSEITQAELPDPYQTLDPTNEIRRNAGEYISQLATILAGGDDLDGRIASTTERGYRFAQQISLALNDMPIPLEPADLPGVDEAMDMGQAFVPVLRVALEFETNHAELADCIVDFSDIIDSDGHNMEIALAATAVTLTSMQGVQDRHNLEYVDRQFDMMMPDMSS